MTFQPDARATLIGSLPLADHGEATRLVLRYVPEIPLWVQLPRYPDERLLTQFAEGLPGLEETDGEVRFNTAAPDFEERFLAFMENYLAVAEEGVPVQSSIFAFSERIYRGFRTFLDAVADLSPPPVALKGQVTGPVTFLTGVKDQDGRMAWSDLRLREASTKGLGLRARYQVEEMRKRCPTALLFFDEPALAGFGSTAMLGVSREDVTAVLADVIETVHQAGGLAGVHVCANTDWSVLFETPVDILSFDAYGFFDRLLLYRGQLAAFLERGGIVAWGLVPTQRPEDLHRESVASLLERWRAQAAALDLPADLVRRQALVTPSCGTGLLSPEDAERVMALTRDLSAAVREA
ncbi:hypothetical protein G3N55_08395 [Dissulfurirhabdus thermomarina]|uniref:Methionine synthase n=1 Tax=Dissulfurirhabdus thermomarina TaxID=1765737 RepID=A0A6N9TNJ5_DISTH|nr:hypothetical protein [Dissulfurirhabdus thermomarina]NDY42861.1 hypothetical protein [Dissulfurirhabdus thermomarina]NMX24441.1 hypothetical protein [Dissulfurirhabdus thermomarina]